MKVYSKPDSSSLAVTETKEVVIKYDYEFLLDQQSRLEAELDEVNTLVTEANKLGITKKVI